MGELTQYHTSLKITRIKVLLEGDFVVISDSVQMKAALDKMKAALD